MLAPEKTTVFPNVDNISQGHQTRDCTKLKHGDWADPDWLVTCTFATTMSSSLVRIHASHRMLLSTCLSYSCRRRAMMSAWSSRSSPQPQTVANPKPPLRDQPPIVIPTSKTPLSPDAASPQIAARPPPVPKTTRPKPTIRAQKAAITLVSKRRSDPTPLPTPTRYPLNFPFFFLLLLLLLTRQNTCRPPWLWNVYGS